MSPTCHPHPLLCVPAWNDNYPEDQPLKEARVQMKASPGKALPMYEDTATPGEQRMTAITQRLGYASGRVGKVGDTRVMSIIEGLRLSEQGNMLQAYYNDNEVLGNWSIPEEMCEHFNTEKQYFFHMLKTEFGLTQTDYHRATTYYIHFAVYPRIVLFPHLDQLIR